MTMLNTHHWARETEQILAMARQALSESRSSDIRDLVQRLPINVGTSVVNLWRWRQGVQPNMHHLVALQDLADGMGLGHLLPRVRVRGR